MFNNFLSELFLWSDVKKCGRDGQTTDDKMAHVRDMLYK
jgi:hypothetical protein